MDLNKPKKDLSNSHNTRVENCENPDIQNRFFVWFEEKGLMNNTRAYIREQMIKALKYGPSWNVNTTNYSSPKVQASNLLVADFLINQKNLFTLSVFITEVPLLGHLHEFSSYVNCSGGNMQSKSITKPTFQLNVVWDILESLGFQPNSNITKLTCQYYFNDENNQINSLFACLFKAITSIYLMNNLSEFSEIQSNTNCSNKSTNLLVDTSYEHRLNNWLISVEDILRSFNLNEAQQNTLIKLLKKYHQNYNAQEATVYKEHLKKLKEKNNELVEKVTNLEQISTTYFHSRNSGLLFQKEQIQYDIQQLQLEQQQLHQSISNLEEKKKSTQEKLNKIEEENNTKLQDIENQKYTLTLKEMEILKHEKILKDESTNIKTKTIESNIITFLQKQNIDLINQLQEIKLKLVDIQNVESSMDKEMISKLQKENNELREFIKTQEQRIEELSNRTSNLTKHIEKIHQIPPTITDYQTRNVKKKIHFVDNSNKKNNYYTNQNISSTTDHSSTILESDNQTEDDMIKKAHSKLKILEINTSKAEKKFQTNHTHHYTDKVFKITNKKPYSDIRSSNLSDDSDFGGLKSNINKINLKELANQIGYHRSMRRSINNSQSENDMSPEILKNSRLRDYTNVTNILPIKTLSSNVNNIYSISPVNRTSAIINSSNNRENCYNTELSIDKSNIPFNQLPKENQLQIETVVINKHPDTNTSEINNRENHIQTKVTSNVEINRNNNNNIQNEDNIDLQLLNHSENNDLSQKQINLQADSLNKVDISSMSKKELESDQTISFGSNKTDKSLDFWA